MVVRRDPPKIRHGDKFADDEELTGNKGFVMFSRSILVLTFCLLLGGIVVAQDPPLPTASPTPFATDKTGTPPEKVGPVPPVAPLYKSNERDIPELSRVGVDMTAQKPLTLDDAILLALENNQDI